MKSRGGDAHAISPWLQYHADRICVTLPGAANWIMTEGTTNG